MQPDQETLDRLVANIVDLVHPLRVILFGSAARGEMGPDSDLDVLVVMPEGTDQAETECRLYAYVPRTVPCDFIAITPNALERYKDSPGLIYQMILQEGRELYAA